jgi:hypothetical protein
MSMRRDAGMGAIVLGGWINDALRAHFASSPAAVWTFGDVEFSTASHSTVRSHLLPMPASFAAPPPCHAHTHTHRERESQRERERQRERKRERESARESEGGGGRRKGGRERVSLCASRSSVVT